LEVSAARPDAFRPDLARSLHNLSNRLADLGRPQDALDAGEEAVTIRRELAARWPDAYRHELEQSSRVVAWLQHGESNASSTHPRGSPGRDNGPLSGLPATLGRSNALGCRVVQNRLICMRHPRAMAW
jgi:Tetratricopeptide repeat